ncbi:glucosaminidase domain-containing protein [Enterococcus raffinosus]|uniref:glucosaminidase domain-containing protein n=2 Tax=Enterococcus TaxID=1350 RepID=UPI001C114AAC|nr:glucosaminidase domain-containing protein [Enterococcus raffinosus]MBU5361892.1 glucosaminidase domain-containing protein [Enterococcus raffinosus]
MKKIVMVICGVAVVCWGVASLRSGALKADNLLQESSVVETTVPESSTVAPAPAEPEPVTEAPEPITETPAPAEPASESSVVPETPVEQQPTESAPTDTIPETPTQSSAVEPPKSDSSTSESSTSSSTSSESSTSQSSTSQTDTTSSSTTTPSESSTSSSSIPGGSTSSTTGNSTGTSSSSSTTTSSSGQEQPQPSTPSTPGPVPSPAPTPPAPSEPKVQTNAAAIQQTPDAFSETSALQLPSDLKTSEVAQSDLKGYELPLLSSFENKAHAALIYDGIKKLGTEQEQDFNVEQLAAKLYSDLFAIEIAGNPEQASEEVSVGSLLYQKKKDQPELVGVYIGKDYYLTVEDVEIDASDESTETATDGVTELDTEKAENEESDKKEKQRQVVLQPMSIDEDLLVQALPTVELTEYGQTILAEYPASINFTENEGAKNFISTIAEDARKLGQEYDVFASVMIAQALLESGSGTSSLSLPPNHNLFGVKGTYQGQAVSMATQEDRGNGELYSINSAFRKYPNYAASLGDYVQLLRGGISGNDGYYKDTWRSTAKNYLRSTQALTGKYATDTSYNRKLNSIIAVYNLTQYDRVKVDQSSGIFIKGKDEIPEEYRTMMRYPDYNGVNYNTSGSYPVGQCTWYAFNRVKQLGKSVDDFMGNGGEWGTKGKALGYEVSREPKAGWLISFTPGTAGSDPRYGHVAFVEVVRPEGILISEGNVYGGTVISYRVIDSNLAKSDLVTYIKAK